MNFSSIGHFAALVAVTLTICLAISVPAHAQCAGLHAGITAQFVQVKPGFTEPAHVRLVFLLINDSDSAVKIKAGSWKIVIDGVEVQDSDWIFGNGPMPRLVTTIKRTIITPCRRNRLADEFGKFARRASEGCAN